MQQAKTRQPVIGGFHSPLEQSVLQLLLQARSPVVAVLARPIAGAKLNPEWKTAIAEERMAVVSAMNVAGRLTEEQATQRNEVVARLAASIVIAYASAGGGLELQSETWARQGLPVPFRLVLTCATT